MAANRFVPLRIFSAFTMLEGAIDPKAIASRARALGFPAAAITDRNGLYGAMAFSEAAKKAARTRKRNAEKRSAAARKGARTRARAGSR